MSEYEILGLSLNRCINLSKPNVCIFLSIPRSNLIDASEIKFNFLEVFIIETLSK